jgi:hypothetical protein
MVLGASLVLFLLVVSIAPFWLHRNQEMLVRTAVAQLNEQQVGHFTFATSRLSPFKQFPHISIEIDSIRFFHDEIQEGDSTPPIYFIHELYLGFDARKILAGEYQIRELTVKGGYVKLVTDTAGQINLVLAKSSKEGTPQEQDSTSGSLALDIDKLHLRDFVVDKTNHELGQHFDFRVEQADLRLSYGQDSIEGSLEAQTQIGDFNVENAHFLQNKQVDLHFRGAYGQESGLLKLHQSSLDLEGVALELKGSVATQDSLRLDLELSGQKKNFDLLLAFAPEDVQAQAKKFQNQGDIFFIGKIKGPSQYDLPAIDLEFGCENAWFVDPNNTQKINDLNFRGHFTMGSERSLRTAELKIENLKARPGEGQFQGYFRVRNFEKPQVEVNLHARLNMAEVSQLLNLEDSTGMKGEMTMDIVLDELIDPDSLDAISAKLQQGTNTRVVFRDFSLEAPWLPFAVQGVSGAVHLEKGALELDSLSLRLDSSDLYLHGKLTHFLAFLHGEPGEVVISLDGRSDRLDLEKLLATESAPSPVQDVVSDLSFGMHFETRSEYLWAFSSLPRGELFIDSFHCRLRDFPHELHDFGADILVDSQTLTVKDFHGEVDNSDFLLTARAKGLDWLDRRDTLVPFSFYLDLKSKHLHLRDLLTYKGVEYLPQEYREEHLSELEIQAMLETTNEALNSGQSLPDFRLDLKDVHFLLRQHRRKFREIHALLLAKDGDLNIQDFTGKLGSSDLRLNGQIKGLTDSLKAPEYAFRLEAQRLDFDELLDFQPTEAPQEHDSAFNIFAEPFPIAKLEAHVGELVYHRFHFLDLHTRVRTTSDHYVYLDTFQAKGADGLMAMSGYFNGSDPSQIYFKSRLQLKEVDIDKLFYKFDNFGQDYLLSENLHGRLTADVRSMVRMHPDFTPIIEESEAHAEARVSEGSILHYAPLQAMSEYFSDKDLDSVRFGELVNTFDLKDGTLHIPNMTITSTLGFLDVTGQQDTGDDLAMDYQLSIPFKMVKKAAFDRVFRRNREGDEMPDEIIEDPGKGMRIHVRVTGTPDDYDVEMGKKKKE